MVIMTPISPFTTLTISFQHSLISQLSWYYPKEGRKTNKKKGALVYPLIFSSSFYLTSLPSNQGKTKEIGRLKKSYISSQFSPSLYMTSMVTATMALPLSPIHCLCLLTLEKGFWTFFLWFIFTELPWFHHCLASTIMTINHYYLTQ